jgi:hypothetical protein
VLFHVTTLELEYISACGCRPAPRRLGFPSLNHAMYPAKLRGPGWSKITWELMFKLVLVLTCILCCSIVIVGRVGQR